MFSNLSQVEFASGTELQRLGVSKLNWSLKIQTQKSVDAESNAERLKFELDASMKINAGLTFENLGLEAALDRSTRENDRIRALYNYEMFTGSIRTAKLYTTERGLKNATERALRDTNTINKLSFENKRMAEEIEWLKSNQH